MKSVLLWGQIEAHFQVAGRTWFCGLGLCVLEMTLEFSCSRETLPAGLRGKLQWFKTWEGKALSLFLGITFAVFWALSAESPAVHFQCQGRGDAPRWARLPAQEGGEAQGTRSCPSPW